MNNDELDARLRSASTPADAAVSDDLLDRATRSHRQPVRDWLATSSPAARRNAGGAIAAVAAAALVLPAAFPTHTTLFALGSSNQSAAGSMLGGADSEADSKMMIMPFITYNYIAGPSLSTEAGSGSVYRFELIGDVQQRAREIATELGVEGTPAKSSYFDEAYPTWVVGPESGSAPNVTISWSGTGSWWFNNPAAYPVQECIDPGQPGDVAGDDESLGCAEYEAPVSGFNPDKTEATAEALALFSALGFSGSTDSVTVYSDEWGTTVMASEFVDGQRIALDWAMSWSGNGEVAYVSGHSARPVSVGTFPTISATDAVARLDDWRWFGSAPMDGVPWMSARTYATEGGLVSGDESDSTSETPNDTVDEPITEPTPTEEPVPTPTEEPVPTPTEPTDPGLLPEPLPTPTVMDLIISNATPQLVLVWDNAGGAWLVPGFVMTADEGWPMAVIALIDGIIQLPEPMPIEPAVEPAVTD